MRNLILVLSLLIGGCGQAPILEPVKPLDSTWTSESGATVSIEPTQVTVNGEACGSTRTGDNFKGQLQLSGCGVAGTYNYGRSDLYAGQRSLSILVLCKEGCVEYF